MSTRTDSAADDLGRPEGEERRPTPPLPRTEREPNRYLAWINANINDAPWTTRNKARVVVALILLAIAVFAWFKYPMFDSVNLGLATVLVIGILLVVRSDNNNTEDFGLILMALAFVFGGYHNLDALKSAKDLAQSRRDALQNMPSSRMFDEKVEGTDAPAFSPKLRDRCYIDGDGNLFLLRISDGVYGTILTEDAKAGIPLDPYSKTPSKNNLKVTIDEAYLKVSGLPDTAQIYFKADGRKASGAIPLSDFPVKKDKDKK